MIGWECPKCGSVYSPLVMTCSRCVPATYAGNTTLPYGCSCGSTAVCPIHAPKRSVNVGAIVQAIAIILFFAGGVTAQPAVTAGTFHGCPEGGRTKVAPVKALNVLKNRATMPDTLDHAVTLEALLAPGN